MNNASFTLIVVTIVLTVQLASGQTSVATRDTRTNLSYLNGQLIFPVTEIKEIVLPDDKRKKNLRVQMFYPQTQKQSPVIIFSHGNSAPGNHLITLLLMFKIHETVLIY